MRSACEPVELPSGPFEVGYGHLLLGLITVRNPTDDAVFIGKLISQRHSEQVALLDDEEYRCAGVLAQIWGSNLGERIVTAQGVGRFWAPRLYRGLDASLEGSDIPRAVGFLIPLLARKIESLH